MNVTLISFASIPTSGSWTPGRGLSHGRCAQGRPDVWSQGHLLVGGSEGREPWGRTQDFPETSAGILQSNLGAAEPKGRQPRQEATGALAGGTGA